jgi:hypothetical protein
LIRFIKHVSGKDNRKTQALVYVARAIAGDRDYDPHIATITGCGLVKARYYALWCDDPRAGVFAI